VWKRESFGGRREKGGGSKQKEWKTVARREFFMLEKSGVAEKGELGADEGGNTCRQGGGRAVSLGVYPRGEERPGVSRKKGRDEEDRGDAVRAINFWRSGRNRGGKTSQEENQGNARARGRKTCREKKSLRPEREASLPENRRAALVGHLS